MIRPRIFIEDCGVVTCQGRGKKAVAHALFEGSSQHLTKRDDLIHGTSLYVGAVNGTFDAPPPQLAGLDCRNNRLLQIALREIAPSIEQAVALFGRDRVAVVMGTSTSGISDGEEALGEYHRVGHWPQHFHYRQQEISSISSFAAQYFGLLGPAYTIATACSSSAKVFASARRLIAAGLADAAIVGGADTLCSMTLNGFHSLELLSQEKCNPFSLHRNGITIGEGASAFLLGTNESEVELLGVGETSDAHHLTAPDPKGAGAMAAMKEALIDASLKPSDISYINLHGTATPLNDAMEAHSVSSLFDNEVYCSSTKGMTGHMLGATGGCEAAFLWLTLNSSTSEGVLPPHVWDGVHDPNIPALNLVKPKTPLPKKQPLAMLSNSFGFGGSNASLILGRVS